MYSFKMDKVPTRLKLLENLSNARNNLKNSLKRYKLEQLGITDPISEKLDNVLELLKLPNGKKLK